MVDSRPRDVVVLMEVDIAGMFSMVDELAGSGAPTTCAEVAAFCTAVRDDAFDDAFELSDEADDT